MTVSADPPTLRNNGERIGGDTDVASLCCGPDDGRKPVGWDRISLPPGEASSLADTDVESHGRDGRPQADDFAESPHAGMLCETRRFSQCTSNNDLRYRNGMTTPADRLKAARIKAGFKSATAAAKAFGWTESTYLGHENGSRGLQIDAAQRYSRAFRVSWNHLMTGTKDEASEGSPGTPVLGHLGVQTEAATSASEAPILPVGAEGYSYEELAAYIAEPGPPTTYVIVCTTKGQPIMVGDEMLISAPNGTARALTTWVISQRDDGSEWYVPYRGAHPEETVMSHEDFFAIDGLELVGVVVAAYEDKRRRKSIDASGLWR